MQTLKGLPGHKLLSYRFYSKKLKVKGFSTLLLREVTVLGRLG